MRHKQILRLLVDISLVCDMIKAIFLCNYIKHGIIILKSLDILIFLVLRIWHRYNY